ncbi:helix-turn-helix domain-containing protein [Scandinavium lactucae]|uniref:Helix-turn-helix transcriptional regulator n=1 Tax=Scandinavium lactucae TaxID=3095028 RepID=A0ABU4QT34_9ENTR|nr:MULTISPECIES: helix-turn-helix transcriptional regulator [unclassified Scandinavium]MDX6041279.1 helix-turn-helix transcriptional regulator [Scandinavium sp. V105_6]MDX6049797.1 helix-turn-helix transcriptional regulator [Scandinavium sp. V105_1]
MVPKRLKAARKAAGLSQKELAELIEVDGSNPRSRLSNYEVGRFTPSFDVIVRIAKVLDYPESYFYTIDDGFAEKILQYHRTKNSEVLNPFFNAEQEAKKYKSSLEESKKMVERLLQFINKSSQ